MIADAALSCRRGYFAGDARADADSVMTLFGIKQQLALLCSASCANLHGGRFAECVVECVQHLKRQKKRIEVLKFDRSIWSYYFGPSTDWVLRGVASALKPLGVYTVTLIDGVGKTMLKARHTGKYVRHQVDPLLILCAWLGPNHPAVRALNLDVPDFLREAAERVHKGAALFVSKSMSEEADYDAYEATGFCVVRKGDIPALLDRVRKSLGRGLVMEGVGDADALDDLLGLVLCHTATVTKDGDAALTGRILTHEPTNDRCALYDTLFEGDELKAMLWRALNLLGKGDCMVRDVLSRTTKRDAGLFKEILDGIKSGHITGLSHLLDKAGASRAQRLHVYYALHSYFDAVWCVDGSSPCGSSPRPRSTRSRRTRWTA